jgi:hypothetical protein
MAHVPGRKSLVWVTDAFPFTMGYRADDIMDWRPLRLNFEARIKNSMKALIDANVAVHPVDTRGLFGVAMGSAETSTDFGQDGASIPASVMEANQSMDFVAAMTGGKTYRGRNDFDGAVSEVIEGCRVTYVLAYQPEGLEWDGKFHPIQVKVSEPRLVVRSRRGYFATPPDQSSTPLDQMRRALASPMEATELSIMAAVKRSGNHWEVTLVIDTLDLALISNKGKWTGGVDMVLRQEASDGRGLDLEQLALPFKWGQGTFNERVQTGTRLVRTMKVEAGAARLRIAVRDQQSGRLGTITVPLESAPSN